MSHSFQPSFSFVFLKPAVYNLGFGWFPEKIRIPGKNGESTLQLWSIARDMRHELSISRGMFSLWGSKSFRSWLIWIPPSDCPFEERRESSLPDHTVGVMARRALHFVHAGVPNGSNGHQACVLGIWFHQFSPVPISRFPWVAPSGTDGVSMSVGWPGVCSLEDMAFVNIGDPQSRRRGRLGGGV